MSPTTPNTSEWPEQTSEPKERAAGRSCSYAVAWVQALKWLQAASGAQAQARLQAYDAKVQKLLQEDPPPVIAAIPWEMRRKAAVRISQLNDRNVAHVMQILEHLQPQAVQHPARPDADAVLDIDKLSLETLEKLQVRRRLSPPPPPLTPLAALALYLAPR